MNSLLSDYAARARSFLASPRGTALTLARMKQGMSIEDAIYLPVIMATGLQDDSTVRDVIGELTKERVRA